MPAGAPRRAAMTATGFATARWGAAGLGSGDNYVTERAWPEVNDVECTVVLSLPRDAGSMAAA